MGGGDKCLLDLAGRPLLSHVIERFRPQVAKLVLNANGDPSRFDAFGLPVVPDRDDALKGPLAGILAGMAWTRANMPLASFIATAASDTPLLPLDLVARLRQALDERPRIAIARSGGRDHHVFGLFPLSLAENLAGFLAHSPRLAVMAWIDRHPWTAVPFEPDASDAPDPFFNINAPTDLDSLQSKMANSRFYKV